MWGVTYLLESVGRGWVVLTAHTATALLVNHVVQWVAFLGLLAVSVLWGNRVRDTT